MIPGHLGGQSAPLFAAGPAALWPQPWPRLTQTHRCISSPLGGPRVIPQSQELKGDIAQVSDQWSQAPGLPTPSASPLAERPGQRQEY